MKGIRLTSKEVDALNLIRPTIATSHPRLLVTFDGLLNKIDKARNTSVLGITPADVRIMERDLVEQYPHKVLPLNIDAAYMRASRQATLIMNTSTCHHDMAVMGLWLNKQAWVKSQLTILDLLNKWLLWWPKAESFGREQYDIREAREVREQPGGQESSSVSKPEGHRVAPGRTKKGLR